MRELDAVNGRIVTFNKTTGASVLGPVAISTIWSGFGGVCEFNGHGDPIALYDQLANRWLISQFAGASIPTDECIAVSTTRISAALGHLFGLLAGPIQRYQEFADDWSRLEALIEADNKENTND